MDSYKTFQAVSDLELEVKWLFAVSAVNDIGQIERAVTSKAVKLDKPIGEDSYEKTTYLLYDLSLIVFLNLQNMLEQT